MRLINTTSLELEDFESTHGLRYAILSHRWGAEEILFNDLSRPEQARHKQGFKKLANFCERAAARGFRHVWLDTCCIDKTSSAELSEAINSMWRWYADADVCFAYLADVTASTVEIEFPQSEWFERGWTLQELLAPPHLEFYNADWVFLGNRDELYKPISAVTGIREAVISRRKPIQQCRVAERMSWAAFRKTSRVEDRAYSLLGIFDVNMPLLYGEAEKAFVRLQEEIIKESNDQSIFDWTEPASDHYRIPSNLPPTGLLAGSPHSFRHWHGKLFDVTASKSHKLFPHTITSCGLLVKFDMLPYKCGIFIAVLDYFRDSATGKGKPCIFLRMLNFQQQFARVAVDQRHLIMFSEVSISPMALKPLETPLVASLVSREIYVPQKKYKLYNSSTLGLVEPLICSISVKCAPNMETGAHELSRVQARTDFEFDAEQARTETDRPGALGLLRLKCWQSSAKQTIFTILVGFDADLRLVCVISTENSFELAKFLSPRGNASDDVSVKHLSKITCMESKGWHFPSDYHLRALDIAEQTPGRPGFWAIRNEHKSYLYMYLDGGSCFVEAVTRLTSPRLSCSITLMPQSEHNK